MNQNYQQIQSLNDFKYIVKYFGIKNAVYEDKTYSDVYYLSADTVGVVKSANGFYLMNSYEDIDISFLFKFHRALSKIIEFSYIHSTYKIYYE